MTEKSYTLTELDDLLQANMDSFAKRFAQKIRAHQDDLPSLNFQPEAVPMPDGSFTINNPRPLVEYIASVIGVSAPWAIAAFFEVVQAREQSP